MKKFIVFDLDGTLATSKQAVDEKMRRLFVELLDIRSVVVISGGDRPQFERQLLGRTLIGSSSLVPVQKRSINKRPRNCPRGNIRLLGKFSETYRWLGMPYFGWKPDIVSQSITMDFPGPLF